jgi:preprotein translocase subunit SecG
LIPGNKLGYDEDYCYLGITGYIPDEEKIAVLG